MRVTFVNSEEGDWYALYIDDKLVYQDSVLRLSEIINHVTGQRPEVIEVPVEKYSKVYYETGLPADLNVVKRILRSPIKDQD